VITQAKQAIEALGKNIAAYCPKVYAIFFWKRFAVGSSPNTSSPTYA
jgi:hypothetical protein